MEEYANNICGNSLIQDHCILKCACGQSNGIRIFNNDNKELQRLIHCEACHQEGSFMQQGD